MKIFINYRREDSAGEAGRLADRLIQKYGMDNIFMDIDSIDPGIDFVDKLEEALGQCKLVLALIGQKWLSAEGKKGQRRIEDPQDFVRIELVSALDQGISIIPILLQQTKMPKEFELPEELKSFANKQAIDIRHEYFHSDIELIFKEIDKLVIKPKKIPKLGEALSTKDYFEVVLPTMLRWKGESATKPNCTILWQVLGKEGGNWYIVLKSPTARVQKHFFEKPDLTIKITEKAMQGVLSGKFNARKEVANGEIELYGDLSLLKKIGFLFQSKEEIKPANEKASVT